MEVAVGRGVFVAGGIGELVETAVAVEVALEVAVGIGVFVDVGGGEFLGVAVAGGVFVAVG